MTTYISILRGINVSGRHMIKMEALKRLFESLDFQKVTTYLQSGNVIFSSGLSDHKKIENRISSQIEEDFGFKVPVIVMTVATLKRYIEENPLIKNREESFLHFTFLGERPIDSYKERVIAKKAENEEIEIMERVVYLYCPNGYGKTKLSNTYLENILKVTATTRNFKTTNALLRIAEQER